MFFHKLVDRKNDKVKFVVILEINEEFISVLFGCIRFIFSYSFLSSSSDSLVETIVDKNHRSPKNLKKSIDGGDDLLNIGNEIETLVSEDKTIEKRFFQMNFKN